MLFGAALVFFMQVGFALLEVGSVSIRNTKNTLFKNLLGTYRVSQILTRRLPPPVERTTCDVCTTVYFYTVLPVTLPVTFTSTGTCLNKPVLMTV